MQKTPGNESDNSGYEVTAFGSRPNCSPSDRATYHIRERYWKLLAR